MQVSIFSESSKDLSHLDHFILRNTNFFFMVIAEIECSIMKILEYSLYLLISHDAHVWSEQT